LKAIVLQKRRKQQLAKIKQVKPRVKKIVANKVEKDTMAKKVEEDTTAKKIEKDTTKTMKPAAPKKPAKK